MSVDWPRVGVARFQAPEYGFIVSDKNGYRSYLRQQSGPYFLDVWVKRNAKPNSNVEGGQPFYRAARAAREAHVRPRDIVAPIGEAEEVGLREREARQRKRVRDVVIEIEDEEAVRPRTTAATYTPSAEQFERHCQTHLPSRN